MPRKVCPECGSSSIAKILWGYPAWSPELEEDMEAGRTVLGGCCVSGNDPRWHCNDCSHEW